MKLWEEYKCYVGHRLPWALVLTPVSLVTFAVTKATRTLLSSSPDEDDD